ncbi:MAG: sigma-70 family RNA polymerase sigma factor [Sphingobacteriales bacterium]|nr:sigma-70 family RNA polymerase sigma factor [Sphingobacteriales bacterium]
MSAGFNDSELISRVLRGDQQAYAGLVHRYQYYVFTLTLRLVKNREEAEEVAQDVFIKAYKYLADFRGDARFSTWLYTIVNNTCISFLRRKKLTVYSLDDEKVFNTAANREAGYKADTVEQKSRQAMVNAAISHLKPDDAAIITLFYKNEQTLDEIARVLGLEANTAKVRLHRARARLKELMETHFAQEVKDLN